MRTNNLTRRSILGQAVSAATLLAISACSGRKQPAITCADPNRLSDAELSLRGSLQYTDQSADAAKACSVCAYFRKDGSADCGKCEILNGLVSARGHCTSWSPAK